VEMLGVLAIMGVITAAAVRGIPYAFRLINRNEVQSDVAKITTGIQSWLGNRNDYSELDNNIAWAAIGVVPKTPLGGKYELAVNSSNPEQYVLSITGLSSGDCGYFAKQAWLDSVGYKASAGRQGGATASPSDCGASGDANIVRITFGSVK